MHPSTRLALAGQQTDGCYNSIVPPLYQTAIFRFEDLGVTKGFDYTRSGNPTRKALEDILATLDDGAGAVATTSGMAAISTVLSLFDAGSHLICSHDCYGGTERLLSHLSGQGKLDVSFVDLTSPTALNEAIKPNTRAIWVETPSNPLLRIIDLETVAGVARASGLTLIVDNTFLSPLFQQPLALGADLVVYSTTKYINGHSDVVGGAIVAQSDELNEQIQFTANAHGTIAQPFDCWLVLRGLKTLPLRLKQHEENALAVARYLERHPRVARVFYPGLASHEGYDLAQRQQKGNGGMVSFSLKGGSGPVNHLLRSTRVFALAESLGGVESLIEHPATMSHASMRPEQRSVAGITDDVIRLSIGIESIDDLIADLEQALHYRRSPQPQHAFNAVSDTV
ncbi:MAG: trans-sulfuration enzyme family protein [Rhodothermales bacterium]